MVAPAREPSFDNLGRLPIAEAILLGEIVSAGNRRKDLIDRPREYADAGVPYFLRVDFRNQVPALALHELINGDYRPVVAAAAGDTFTMTDSHPRRKTHASSLHEPFAFSINPAALLDTEG